jgi:hypothetical protein
MATTVRVDERLARVLRELAREERRPIGRVIEDAIQQYRKERFWQGVQEDFARLRSDPVAWKAYEDEVTLWDATASDGLENEEPYYSPEEEAEISEHYARTYGR